MTAVHQFVPTFAPRDAVGAHSLGLREILRDAGYHSNIYALEARGPHRRTVHDFRSFPNGRRAESTFLLYQMSVGSALCDFVLAREEPLIVNYHNITPVEFFRRWEPVVATQLEHGRRQLTNLAPRASLGLAVSRYNAYDLAELGFRSTAVAPVFVDPAVFATEPDAAVVDRVRQHGSGGGAQWLFVGRLAPNKAQHDIVKAFAAYRRFYDPRARLHLVGGSSSHAYENALRAFIAALGIADAVELTGSVSEAALAGYYESADVFVILSEHEGFCVPLLEAMHHRLPIVAHARAGIPETLGPAGVLLPDKEPFVVAEAVHRVVTDTALRKALVATGSKRLTHFSPARIRDATLTALAEVTGPP